MRSTVLRMVAVFVAIGLIATVLVAWIAAAAARIASRSATMSDVNDGSERWTITAHYLPAGLRLESQRTRGMGWSPEQAAGAPDTPRPGDQTSAWASLGQDDQDEWLELSYRQPVAIKEIHVHENFCPGALVKATSLDRAGKETILWEGVDPTPTTQPSGISILPVRAAGLTDRVKLYLDSKQVKGWNEIDAVGLKDHAGKIHWARHVKASSTYAQQGTKPAAIASTQLPHWVESLRQPSEGFVSGDSKTEKSAVEARGWPALALWRPVDSPDLGTLRLPLRPIWSGILFDAFIYGAAALLGWLLVVVFLRRFVVESLRLRRGHCMLCGYDLQFNLAAGCPECGCPRRQHNSLIHRASHSVLPAAASR